jgi:hypothetical protein
MTDQPRDEHLDTSVDDDDQDSEPTMKAPDDRRPDGTVADLHGEGTSDGDHDGSGSGGS